jgi:hypothetical protein
VRYQELGVGGWIAVVILFSGIVWGIRQSKKPVAELK